MVVYQFFKFCKLGVEEDCHRSALLHDTGFMQMLSPFRAARAGHFSVLASLFLFTSMLSVIGSDGSPIHVGRAENGIIATVDPAGTDAAIEVFKKGGNAIDAAVAAGLTLGVVDGSNAGIGGGCFILVRRSNGEVFAIDGRETAPAAAHPDMYLVDGKGDTSLSQTGPLASGVPGAVAAYALAVEKFGNLPLSDLLEPGARIAEEGFVLTESHERAIARHAEDFRRFEGSREVFFDADGNPLKKGDLFRQTDLAKTYRGIAEHGIDYFYRGPVSKKIAAWMAENGGIMTEKDFAEYRAPFREPVKSTYRGNIIYGMPPSSSGGVHVAQILNILEHFDLSELEEADRVHVIAEAMKLAFADRAHWLGDADFVDVPKGLAAPEYGALLAERIKMKEAIEVPSYSYPPGWEEDLFSRHTTHFSAADSEGNWVAITATVNTGFGSKVIVPGTGVILNNEMDDFSIQPGVPNAFGLIGGEANKVEAGKRPLSAMSPTIVLDSEGEPFLSAGAAGGPTIITQTVLAIIGVVDLKMDVGEALAQPRFHTQWVPNTLRIDRRFSEDVIEDLRSRGHEIRLVNGIGVSQAVARDGDGFIGAHDPRVEGKVGGF